MNREKQQREDNAEMSNHPLYQIKYQRNNSTVTINDILYVPQSELETAKQEAIDAFLRGEGAKQYMSEVQDRAKQEERERIIGILEGMKLHRTRQSASESACYECGFNNDRRQCYCQYNYALDQVIKRIE
jgi:hypothetical protein